MDLQISISSIKIYIRDKINLIEDGKAKKWIESVYDRKKNLFIYDGIANIKPNSGHEIWRF